MSNISTTSEDILRCAQSLIVAGGYNGFSYADISKVVGIRSASIHHHFPFKSDLVGTLVARYREQAASGITELERQIPDPVGQLRAYLGYWEMCIADASAPLCVCAMLASEIPALPENVALEVRAHFRTLSAWLATVLERGAEQGSFRLTGTAKAEAEIFMATVHGAMLSARAYDEAKMFGHITHPLLERLTIHL
jgi:TetR/AcrR family transcriptional repressor of nem operon